MDFMKNPEDMSDEEVMEALRRAEAYRSIGEEGDDQDEPTEARGVTDGAAARAVDMFEWSEAIQRDMLNLCLTDQEFMIQAQRLIEPGYFTSSYHRSIYKIISENMRNYLTRPTLAVLEEELSREYAQAEYLQAVAELEEVADDERYKLALRSREYIMDKMIKFAKMQAMKSAIHNVVAMVSEDRWDDIEEEFRKALLVSPNIELGTSFFRDVDARYQRLLNETEGEAFTLGFQSIDNQLNGGIRRKEIGMVFAPPGVGKSLWLAHASIANARRGKRVLYVSLEMAEDRIANRMDSMTTHIPIAETLVKHVEVKRKLGLLFSAWGENEVRIKEFPPGAMKMEDLKAYIHQLKVHEGWVPDLLVLDYIDEAKSDARLESYEAQMRLTRSFRGLMVEMNMAGLTATQSNRKARDVEVITDAEIGDSYGKVRIVDGMWSINQRDDEKAFGLARIYVVKHRNGQSRFAFPIYINKQTLAMQEVSQQLVERMRANTLTKEDKIELRMIPPSAG